MKKVLITGATGFVGTNLSAYLSPRSWEVHTARVRHGDFVSVDDVDAVVHLAGKAHDLHNIETGSDYMAANFYLTKDIFEAFLLSSATCFIYLSSVKAVADAVDGKLMEEADENPATWYGKSKLAAEQFLQSHPSASSKKVFILRPCMVHGPGNKGNLNLLYKLVRTGIPWPLGAFENNRSFLSVENLCFTILEFISRNDIPPGIYNVADTDTLSTNEVIKIMSSTLGKKPRILPIGKGIIKFIARIGDALRLPLNSERLRKLTETYIVSNDKLLHALKAELPVKAADGIQLTVKSFAAGSEKEMI